MISPVARRYGKAIFSVADEKNIIEKIAKELSLITEVFSDNKIFEFFSSPIISKEEKLKGLEKFGDIDKELKNFLEILIEKNRIDNIAGIYEYYKYLELEKNDTTTVTIVSSFELSDEVISKIKDKIKSRLGKNLVIKSTIDKEIIGGIVIKYGDTVLDGSLTRQLYEIKQKIKEGK